MFSVLRIDVHEDRLGIDVKMQLAEATKEKGVVMTSSPG